MVILAGCSCESPPEVAALVATDDGRVLAGVTGWDDGSITDWYATGDEGLSWERTDERPIVPDQAEEICGERGVCYRALGGQVQTHGLDVIQQSRGGGEWKTVWDRAVVRREFLTNSCASAFDVNDMLVIDGDDDHVLLVASSTNGVLRRDRNGSWKQLQVGSAESRSLSGSPPALLTFFLAIAWATVAAVVFLIVLVTLGARKMRFSLSAITASAAVVAGFVTFWLIYALWVFAVIDRLRVALVLATVLGLAAAVVVAAIAHVRLAPHHLKAPPRAVAVPPPPS